MVAAKGGPSDFVERWRDRLPAASVIREVMAPRSGTVTAIDCHALGMAVVRLGGGRLRRGDVIDPSVGISGVVGIGAAVDEGDPVALVHGANRSAAEMVAAELATSFSVTNGSVSQPRLVHGTVV